MLLTVSQRHTCIYILGNATVNAKANVVLSSNMHDKTTAVVFNVKRTYDSMCSTAFLAGGAQICVVPL